MLKYQPKGALSPDLAAAMSKLFKIISDRGLMAALSITDGRHGEFHISLDPDWSCCTMNKLPGGDVSVRIKSARKDYVTTEDQKATLERTVSGLAMLFKMVDTHRESLTSVMSDLHKQLKFSHYGEEFKGHTTEPPDPDKVPTTLEEAAELIFATMDDDMIGWVKKTPIYDALPQLHHGFGQQLRNSWSLWEKDTPLHKHVRERLGLWGHADDITTLIFSVLWSKVRGEPTEVAETALTLEAEGMKLHWRKDGINPETGEKGIIL